MNRLRSLDHAVHRLLAQEPQTARAIFAKVRRDRGSSYRVDQWRRGLA